jgi:hypothetical protein
MSTRSKSLCSNFERVAPGMTNVEAAMTNEDGNRNDEQVSAGMTVWPGRSGPPAPARAGALRASAFGLRSAFWFRHSTFGKNGVQKLHTVN